MMWYRPGSRVSQVSASVVPQSSSWRIQKGLRREGDEHTMEKEYHLT